MVTFLEVSIITQIICIAIGCLAFFLYKYFRKGDSPILFRQYLLVLSSFIVIASLGGFLAGFFGPIFLTNSDQGPLLGIFVTGPLGAVVGLILFWGYLYFNTKNT